MNDHKGSRRRRPRPAAAEPRAGPAETTLKSDRLQIERKQFLFDLCENPRGRFLRVTEDSHGHRDRIIIPAPGLRAFQETLADMIHAAEEPPEPPAAPDAGSESSQLGRETFPESD